MGCWYDHGFQPHVRIADDSTADIRIMLIEGVDSYCVVTGLRPAISSVWLDVLILISSGDLTVVPGRKEAVSFGQRSR